MEVRVERLVSVATGVFFSNNSASKGGEASECGEGSKSGEGSKRCD